MPLRLSDFLSEVFQPWQDLKRAVPLPHGCDGDGEHCRAGRVAPLDGIRSFALLWVFAEHSFTSCFRNMYTGVPIGSLELKDFVLMQWWGQWPLQGNTGVDSFFVLSGMMISSAYLRFDPKTSLPLHIALFLLRRFFRIWPMVVAAVLSGYLLAACSPEFAAKWNDLAWVHLFLIPNFFKESLNSVLAHLWSVSVEMQMYLLTPILCELIFDRKAGKRRPWAYALLALISLASLALRGWWILGPPQMIDLNRWDGWPPPPHYINTFARISPYLSGITLQLVLDEKAQEGNKAEAEAGNAGRASLMLARAARAFGSLLLDLAAVAGIVLSGLFGCYYLPAPSFMDEVLGARGKQCSVAFWPPLFGWSLARCLYHILTAPASRLNPWYWCQQFLGLKLWFHVALLSYSAYVVQNHAVLPLIMLDERLRLNWSGLGRGDAPVAMVRYAAHFFFWTLCCCLVALPCHVFVEVPGMRLGRMLDRALRRCCQKSCKGLGPKVEVVCKDGAGACRDSGFSEIVSTDTSASSCV